MNTAEFFVHNYFSINSPKIQPLLKALGDQRFARVTSIEEVMDLFSWEDSEEGYLYWYLAHQQMVIGSSTPRYPNHLDGRNPHLISLDKPKIMTSTTESQRLPAAWFFATKLNSKTFETIALNACSLAQSKKEVSNVSEALNVFDWNKTTQGYDFWLGIYAQVVGPSEWNPQIKTPIVYSEVPKPSVTVDDQWHQAKGCIVECNIDPYAGFREQISRKEAERNKKIIGYKTPHDLFGGRIKRGDVFTKSSPKGLVMYTGIFTTSGVPTEIVKTWEPVYAPEVIELILGRPEVKVTISADTRIEAKGQLVGWGIIEQIKNEMVLNHLKVASWPVSYPEVVIGCSRFSREDIKKIWDAFIKLNPQVNKKS